MKSENFLPLDVWNTDFKDLIKQPKYAAILLGLRSSHNIVSFLKKNP